jgi:hypothetical protein
MFSEKEKGRRCTQGWGPKDDTLILFNFLFLGMLGNVKIRSGSDRH